MKKFEQMKRLYQTIQNYQDPEDFGDGMLSGVTADFDRLFELAWKTLKEYMRRDLLMREADTGSPKEILRLAWRQDLIHDETLWIGMLKDRSDDTHHYHHSAAVLYLDRIRTRYLPEMGCFIEEMSALIPPEELPDDRIPESFFRAWKKTDLSLEAFTRQIAEENGWDTLEEVFARWPEIGSRYV